MRKPIISVIIGMSLLTNVYASPGPQETPMNLNAEAAVFSVTIPTTMEIHIDEGGVVTTPSIVSIVNNSSAPVKVNNVEITPSDLSEWSIVDFNTDMNREKISSKKVGIQINGCETDSSGIFQFDPLNFPSIAGKDSMILEYDAVVPTQRTEIVDTNIAKVVFTIGWDIADGSESGGGGTGGGESTPTDPTNPTNPGDTGDTGDTGSHTDPDTGKSQEWIDNNFEFVSGPWSDSYDAPNSYGGERGYFIYIGTDTTVTVPTEINGHILKDTFKMFFDTSVEKVINTNPNITNMNSMFRESQATTLDLSELDTSNVTDMEKMFRDSLTTTIEGLDEFDTSNVTNMGSMFHNSPATELDVSNFDTSNVTNMGSMFYNSPATELDVSNFDTSNVTIMYRMFQGSQVTALDLSNFNTSKVTNMLAMFQGSPATALDLSSFDTSNVISMSQMFSNSQATTLDLSSFNTSNVTDMGSMFSYSQATTLDLSSFDTSNVTNMDYMFLNSQATTLDLSSFNTSDDTRMSQMFDDALATTGYARTQSDADNFNRSPNKPDELTFTVK